MSILSRRGFSALPAELWLVIIDMLLANTKDYGRFLDLANLARTCRSAYMAARRPTWRHLRLMLRINTECILPPYLDNDRVDSLHPLSDGTHLAVQHHRRVFKSSMFPLYRAGQLALESERLERIRQVSHEYVHLQPFVVLEGKLYLASLAENERNPSDPDFSGILSLWGGGDQSLSAGARVVGGLVLVPYPLHWVNELTVDALGSGSDIGDCLLTRKAFQLEGELSFLFRMDPKQVRSLHFFTDSAPDTSSIHVKIGRHFAHTLVNHNYFLDGGEHSSPEFGAATQTVRLFHSKLTDSDRDLFAALASTPIRSFELLGAGYFSTRFPANNLMVSTTLTQLVLGFDVHIPVLQHDPFKMHLPALEQFTLTFAIAKILFDPDLSDIMFPAPNALLPSSINTSITFPALTGLTLLDIDPKDTPIRPPGHVVYIPWIPFHHMPQLADVHVPFGLRESDRQAMHPGHLQQLVSQTKIQSLNAYGLDAVWPGTSEPDFTDPPVSAQSLKHIKVSLTAAYHMSHYVNSTPNLVSAKLDVEDTCTEIPFFANAPNLTHLHLYARDFHPGWWSILARTLPQLTYLKIHDTEPVEQVGADYEVAVDSTTNAFPCLPNLEYLTFTMTNGTYNLNDLKLPRLKHLVINMEHPRPMPSVYPNLDSLQITGAQCPSTVMHLLDALHLSCQVKLFPPATAQLDPKIQLCSMDQLRVRFSSDRNRHVWQALLDGPRFAKREGLIKESVQVEVEATTLHLMQDGDALLIARVLAHLLAEQEPSSMTCSVVCASNGSLESVDRSVATEWLTRIVCGIRGQGLDVFRL